VTDPVKSLVRKTTVASAAIGAVLSPIPLVDELVLFPVYLGLAAKIGATHDLKWRALPWRPICLTTVNGLLARAVANLAVSYLPGVAAVANAASAAALTALLGDAFDAACRDPGGARPIGVKAVVSTLKEKLARRPEAQAA
jgi:uncharacterized protein (DUF697 family)